MKIIFTITAIVAFAFALMSIGATTITIVNISDTHSCLSPGGPRNGELQGTRGGAARFTTSVSQLDNPVIIHSGDIFIGDLFFNKYFGVPELTYLKSINCSALILGNHEFDLTCEVLKMSLGAAFEDSEFPIISSNFETFDNPELAELRSIVQSNTIVEREGVKIGIFGLTTYETNFMSFPQPAFIDTLILEKAEEQIALLKGLGCQIIIMASHLGKSNDELIASYTTGIDLILGGHDHLALSDPILFTNLNGDKIPFVSSGAFYQSYGKTIIEIENSLIKSVEYELVPLDESIPEEPNTKSMIDQLIAGIEETYGPLYSLQIAEATEDLEEISQPKFSGIEYLDTPIGNLVADAFREFGKTDIAIEPGGSTSQKICKGPLVGDDIFRVIGYGFNETNGLGYNMVKFDMLGEYLIFGLEYGLSKIEENDESLLQVSGMTYEVDLSKPPYSRIVSIYINGKPIDPSQTYSVTTNLFVAEFLKIMMLPIENLEVINEITEFEVLLNYVSEMQVISSQAGRITSPVKDIDKRKSSMNFDMTIVPNPCSEFVTLHISDLEYGLYDIIVTDLRGVTMLSNEIQLGPNVGCHKLNTNLLPSGSYLISITGMGITSNKLLNVVN